MTGPTVTAATLGASKRLNAATRFAKVVDSHLQGRATFYTAYVDKLHVVIEKSPYDDKYASEEYPED